MEAVLTQEAPTTAELYRETLAERAEEVRFDPGEVRLSEIGSCDRRQTLRMLGYEPETPSERQQSIFQAGEEHEDTIYALWAARYPRRVRRQVPVRFPQGTGHIDIWVAPIKHIVESKSVKATARRYLPMEHHVWQVKAYLWYWGHQRRATAEIAYRLKETGEIVSFPVTCSEADGEEIERRVDRIVAARQAGLPLPIPEGFGPDRFPCAWEDRVTGEWVTCPFWRHCYTADATARTEGEGRKARTVLEVSGSLADTLHRLAEGRERLRQLAAEERRVRQELEPVEAMAAKLLADAGAQVLVGGGLEVQGTPVPGRAFYDIEQALADGVVAAEALAPYRREGKGYIRWSVRHVGGGSGGRDTVLAAQA